MINIEQAQPRFAQPRRCTRVDFGPPPPGAMSDPAIAQAWVRDAFDRADEIGPCVGRGLPRREETDGQVFALARNAKPVRKGRILHTLAMTGRLVCFFTEKPLAQGACLLLHRLVGLLSVEHCQIGKFEIRVTNGTLAAELDVTERSISRSLAQLHHAGFIYRHFTTGTRGLDRISVDLGPLVARLDELKASVARRAAGRAEARLELVKCATSQLQESTPVDSRDNHNTSDQESLEKSTVFAREDAVAHPVRQTSQRLPAGTPNWNLTTTQVLAVCPTLTRWATVGVDRPDWSDVVNAARTLSISYGLSEHAWAQICLGLGREWAAVLVGIVAEKPAESFARSSAPDIGLKRAGYLAGIARKFVRKEEVNILPTWYRHKKSVEIKGARLGRTT